MARLLTKRKARWVESRKPDVVRGTPLNYPVTVETRYYLRIEKAIKEMVRVTESELRALFSTKHAKEFFASDASIASQARIVTNALKDRFDKLFASIAPGVADQMAGGADKASSASLHGSLKELSGGLSLSTKGLQGPLTDVLKATITENVGLIKTIPAQYLDGVQGAVMRSITTGNGMQDLVPYLQKHKDITLRRAQLIASDQTRKAYNNLNKGRMTQIGLKKFEWLHTSGSREPRKLHQEYSGRIFSFDDLPVIDERTGERGIPGQAINCRCRMCPVLDFGDD